MDRIVNQLPEQMNRQSLAAQSLAQEIRIQRPDLARPAIKVDVQLALEETGNFHFAELFSNRFCRALIRMGQAMVASHNTSAKRPP
jgi:hypothetical protein